MITVKPEEFPEPSTFWRRAPMDDALDGMRYVVQGAQLRATRQGDLDRRILGEAPQMYTAQTLTGVAGTMGITPPRPYNPREAELMELQQEIRNLRQLNTALMAQVRPARLEGLTPHTYAVDEDFLNPREPRPPRKWYEFWKK